MPLTTTKKMLKDAQKNHYAIGAFNFENMEMAQAVISAATETGCPVILQTTPKTLGYGTPQIFASMITAMAQEASIQVAIQLDHGNSHDMVLDAMAAGYTAVMYDVSHLPFNENISTTQELANIAAERNISIEAELGSIGGKEDDLEAEIEYTNPDAALEFVAQTGVNSLAVAIGTAHGVYKHTPILDINRLREIRKCVSIPLVLHGASGLQDNVVQDCIQAGICKVNFATELRIAYTNGVREYLLANPEAYDPKTYGKAGYNRVKTLALQKMAVCGLKGRLTNGNN